ncbi:DUF4136 domain-containing protein [Ohtaekwangia sp.]|uniref:DUF4136 domain-containing protein n=1 Tax=Ohtaekwangia sp. TaxID=2066019 RepID=UPI002F9401E4
MKTKLFFAALMLLSAAAMAQVHVDFDKHIDFKKYKTFKFESGKVIRKLGVTDTDNRFMDANVKEAVTRDLEAKGLTPSDTHPDLIITYLAGAREKQEVQNYISNPGFFYPYYRFYGLGGWWGPQWNNFWVSRYEEGTLIIDILDARTDQLVWRSYAVAQINNFNEAKFVEKEVSKSFKHFPPKV